MPWELAILAERVCMAENKVPLGGRLLLPFRPFVQFLFRPAPGVFFPADRFAKAWRKNAGFAKPWQNRETERAGTGKPFADPWQIRPVPAGFSFGLEPEIPPFFQAFSLILNYLPPLRAKSATARTAAFHAPVFRPPLPGIRPFLFLKIRPGTCTLPVAMKRTSLFPVVLAFAAALAAAAPAETGPRPLYFGDGDKIMVLVPHPGDESLAAAAVLQEAADLELPVQVVCFTAGAPDETLEPARRLPAPAPASPVAAMQAASTRRAEAEDAAAALALPDDSLLFLGYPASALLPLFLDTWRTSAPLVSPTRAAATPAAGVRSPRTPYLAPAALDDLAGAIRDFAPTHLFLPAAEDASPDHRALAALARVALWNLAAEGLSPSLYACPVHFPDWPRPFAPDPAAPQTLPDVYDDDLDPAAIRLAPFQLENKRAAIQSYETLRKTAAPWTDAFLRLTELYVPLAPLSLAESPELHLPALTSPRFRTPDDYLDAVAAPESLRTDLIEADATTAPSANAFLSRTVRLLPDALEITHAFARPPAWNLLLDVALYPWSPATPFADMPKLRIAATPEALQTVRDGTSTLADHGIVFSKPAPNAIRLRIPLALLRHPAKLLLSARILHDATIPLDTLPWLPLEGLAADDNPPPAAPATPAEPAPAWKEEPEPDFALPDFASYPEPEPEPAPAPAPPPPEKPAKKTNPPKKAPAPKPRPKTPADQIMAW